MCFFSLEMCSLGLPFAARPAYRTQLQRNAVHSRPEKGRARLAKTLWPISKGKPFAALLACLRLFVCSSALPLTLPSVQGSSLRLA